MENLEQALIDVLNTAATTAGQAKDFVLAELPDVVEQLLMWHMVESLIFFTAFTLLALVHIPAGWYAVKSARKAQDPMNIIGPTLCLVVFTLPGSIAGMFSNLDWLMILVAPKLYLIEYAASLVK